MQWSAAVNAGFSTAPAWLPLADDIERMNVESEMRDPHSTVNLYRRLIELRRREPALSVGQYVAVPATGDVLVYKRQLDDDNRYLIALNFSNQPAKFHSPLLPQQCKTELSTYLDREKDLLGDTIELRANEGVVIELT